MPLLGVAREVSSGQDAVGQERFVLYWWEVLGLGVVLLATVLAGGAGHGSEAWQQVCEISAGLLGTGLSVVAVVAEWVRQHRQKPEVARETRDCQGERLAVAASGADGFLQAMRARPLQAVDGLDPNALPDRLWPLAIERLLAADSPGTRRAALEFDGIPRRVLCRLAVKDSANEVAAAAARLVGFSLSQSECRGLLKSPHASVRALAVRSPVTARRARLRRCRDDESKSVRHVAWVSVEAERALSPVEATFLSRSRHIDTRVRAVKSNRLRKRLLLRLATLDPVRKIREAAQSVLAERITPDAAHALGRSDYPDARLAGIRSGRLRLDQLAALAHRDGEPAVREAARAMLAVHMALPHQDPVAEVRLGAQTAVNLHGSSCVADSQRLQRLWVQLRTDGDLRARGDALLKLAPSLPSGEEARLRALYVTEWFLRWDGEQRGPFCGAEVQRLLGMSDLAPRIVARRDGMDGWMPVSEIPDFATALATHSTAQQRVNGASDVDAASATKGKTNT